LHHGGILSQNSAPATLLFRVKRFSMWVGGKWRDSVLECGGCDAALGETSDSGAKAVSLPQARACHRNPRPFRFFFKGRGGTTSPPEQPPALRYFPPTPDNLKFHQTSALTEQ